MTRSEFLLEFEDIALQPTGTITGEEALSSLKGWDSLAIVTFMSMADEKLGLQLDPAKIVACRRVIDLAMLCGLEP